MTHSRNDGDCTKPREDGCTAEEQVRALYSQLANHPEKDFGWGKGRENARELGYDEAWLARLPDEVWESAAAVGNPFSLGPIHSGEAVLDLGCGAGADVCVAAMLTGPEGRVIGIDMTHAMAEKAKSVAKACGLEHVEIYCGDMAELPLGDNCADLVISNGAINLSQKKACVLIEAFRVLKPGGRLQVADMVRNESCGCDDAAEDGSRGSWADCVAGTLSPDSFLRMIRDAGFADAELVAFTAYQTAPETIGACIRARKAI